MKALFLFFILIDFITTGVAQKKLIDLSTPSIWPFIEHQKISNDGKYISYTIGSAKRGLTLVVQAADDSWKSEITGGSKGQFTEDNQRFLFTTPTDSLGILELVKKSLRYIGKVRDFRLPTEGGGQFMAYTLDSPENELIVLNLSTGNEKHFQHINSFEFSSEGQVLILEAYRLESGTHTNVLQWVDLLNDKASVIGKGYEVKNLSFNENKPQIAFVAKTQVDGQTVTSLRYYEPGFDSAKILADHFKPGMDGMEVSWLGGIYFSKDEKKIFFQIQKPYSNTSEDPDGKAQVTILNYKDEVHESEENMGPYLAVVHLDSSYQVTRLQRRMEKYPSLNEGKNDDWLVVEREQIDSNGFTGSHISDNHDLYLIQTGDGSRKLIRKRLHLKGLAFSLAGNYLIWYDEIRNDWYTYDIKYAIIRNITSAIKVPLSMETDLPHRHSGRVYNLIGWMGNDKGVLIQDRFDIWLVDPAGLAAPVNLTKGYGFRHNTSLWFMRFARDHQDVFRFGDTLMLSGFDYKTKDNGFFRLILGNPGVMQKLVMEPRVYYLPFGSISFPGAFYPFFPVKAKRADTYLVERMSVSEYPNLYISAGLSSFQPITSLEPEKDYNWFTSQLYHWKYPDGKKAEGILYKPENFDPTKKYPVIFFYYDKDANALNFFFHPALCTGTLNIPWFVSNGYLVFIPDIFYKKSGYPGRDALNAVVSAAVYLSRQSFVDKKHMGLLGHSFGGFETNYIVSRTSLFAAASTAEGVSDLISQYTENEGEFYFEKGQGRIGTILWQKPQPYFENSAIFRADRVTTPVLILQNRADPFVRYNQGESWFSSLSRLGKRSWMLSYNMEEHSLRNEKNKLDYSVRLMQFFDHFLKGNPPPVWMTKGVSSSFPDVNQGLELDYSGKQP